MSKKEYKKKKKVVVTKSKPKTEAQTPKKNVVTKTTSRLGGHAGVSNVPQGEELLYGRSNYMLMGLGVVLMLLGYLLMSGGAQPNADTWDPNIIYNFRRVTLGPVFVLAGIVVEIVAIFKRK